MATVKVKLKNGSREIELDGEMNDVESLLKRWWTPLDAAEEDDESSDDGSKLPEQPARRGKTSKRRGRPAKTPASTPLNSPDPARDANTIANAVKEHKDYDRFQNKIIVGDSSTYNRIAFVCWFVDKPLTSGDIYRALIALNVKINLPTVSTALKKNIGNFITSTQRTVGGPPAEYKLTEKAKSDFMTWLKSDAE